MNKTVLTVASMIRPGKPVMILGPYGSGKEAVARAAVDYLKLKPATVYLGLIDQGFSYDVDETQQMIKSLRGEHALMFSDIQHLKSGKMEEMMLFEMENPDRQIIITGTKCIHERISRRVKDVIHVATDFEGWANSLSSNPCVLIKLPRAY